MYSIHNFLISYWPWISGFLMTFPICLRAWAPAFCTLAWESVSTSEILGTMLGRHADNCLGAQNAIAPNSSTAPVSKWTHGNNFQFKLTALGTSWLMSISLMWPYLNLLKFFSIQIGCILWLPCLTWQWTNFSLSRFDSNCV